MGAAAGGGALPFPLPMEAHPPTLMSATDTANTTIFFIGSPSFEKAQFSSAQSNAIEIAQRRAEQFRIQIVERHIVEHLRCHEQFQLTKNLSPAS
jgi:hypothetical protein